MPPPTTVKVRRRQRVVTEDRAPARRQPRPAPASGRRRLTPGQNQAAQRAPVPDRPPRPGTSNLQLAREPARVDRPPTPRVGQVPPATAPPVATTAPGRAPPVATVGPAVPTAGSVPGAATGSAAAAPARTPRFAAQARSIEADHRAKQAQAQRITAARTQDVAATVLALRAGVTAMVGQVIAGFQARVVAGRARILAAVTAVVTRAQVVVALVAGALMAGVVQAATAVTGLVTRALAAARTGVRAVAGRITGLIASVSLPNVPGISAIRSRAVQFLADAAGFVTARLDDVAAFVQLAATAAVGLVTTLVSGAVALVHDVLARVVALLRRIVVTVAGLLLRLAAVVTAVLRRVLALAWQVLGRVQAFVVGRLRWVLNQALRLLRRNRDRQLATLAELDRRTPVRRGAGPAQPPDPEAREDADRVVADAVTNSTRVVRVLDLVTGGAVRGALGLVRTVVQLFRAQALLRVGQLVARIVAALGRALAALGQVAAIVVAILRSVIEQVQRGIVTIVEAVRQLVQRPLDAVVGAAVAAVVRIRDVVTTLVRRLIEGATQVISDVRSLLGGGPRETVTEVQPPQLAKGPIVLPPPPVLAPILKGFVVVLAFIGALVLFLAADIAVVGTFVAFLLALGIPQFWVLVIVGVVAIVLLILLLVLIVTLLRRKKGPKPKRVLAVNAAPLEVGVGGRDLRVTATLAPGSPSSPTLRWTVNPGGVVPAAIRVLGTSRRANLRAGHPPFGTVTGGVAITVRATLASDATDFADLPGIMVVQVTQAHYDAVPPLFATPPQSDPFPPNTVDPNRDGVAGSSATVVATTAPAGRPVVVRLRRALGAGVAGTTIRPGAATGDILVRIVDNPTGALLDERRPSLLNPPTLMSTLVVDAVPTRVRRLRFLNRLPAGPYSALNDVVFEPSDTRHPPLTRLVGELITLVRDDFSLPPPNGAFNPGFVPALAAPARFWQDQLVTPFNLANTVDGLIAIDVNRFVGPGVPALPRAWIFRQQMVWVAWRAGNVVSVTIADGQHLRTLVRRGAGFGFTTDHTFPGTASRPGPEAYAGPPLIVLTRMVVTPTAAGAASLAADGVSTGNAVVTTTVAGRPVTWTVLAGGLSVPAGNPSIPPAAATVRAGAAAGTFGLRAADTTFGNRRVDGRVRVAAVRLRGMSASFFGPSRTVSVTADPGGRTANWTLDAAAVGAGVTVVPATTGPGPARSSVTVTRPAGFTGTVTVTATDSVLAAATASTTIRFR